MTLYERRTVLCKRLFSKMLEPTHKLNALVPPKNLQTYDLRSNYPNLVVPIGVELNAFRTVSFLLFLVLIVIIIITLAGIVTYFAGYNEQISVLKYILARRIWNCLLPPAIVLS